MVFGYEMKIYSLPCHWAQNLNHRENQTGLLISYHSHAHASLPAKTMQF